MSKKEFLEKLEHKLHLLKQDEIQDISTTSCRKAKPKMKRSRTSAILMIWRGKFSARIRLMINIPMIKAAILSTMSLTS